MNVLEIIWSKYQSFRLLVKCRRKYVINKDEKERQRKLKRELKGEGEKEREKKRERE